jgi:hypothetical protein
MVVLPFACKTFSKSVDLTYFDSVGLDGCFFVGESGTVSRINLVLKMSDPDRGTDYILFLLILCFFLSLQLAGLDKDGFQHHRC